MSAPDEQPDAIPDRSPQAPPRAASRLALRAVWALLAVPGLVQLGLLLYAVARRFAYPYDLEWMEGGLLAHAARLDAGQSMYPPPSMDFIPYLYTPLYPALVALLGQAVGISYQLGRAISVVSILGVIALMGLAIHAAATDRGAATRTSPDASADTSADASADAHGQPARLAAWCGAAVAAGFFAATYPWVEGWYDLVRADALFLFMILGGLLLLRARARAGHGWRGQLGVALAAAVLAASFFCKQTGVLYVATGGALLLVWNWRRLPVYVLTAGVIGLGGTAWLDQSTGGWFWTYIYEVHQAHDFNDDRFYKSFAHILGKFPAMTATVAAGLIAVTVSWIARRRRPAGAASMLCWTFVFAVSCLVGALGWATQWAHFNAYMPAMMTGALAAGVALPALCGAVEPWLARRSVWLRSLPAAALALACGLQLYQARWQPGVFVPTARDRAAGHALIEHIRALRADGDVYLPYHPWYARLAGQDALFTHRMGLMDLGYGNHWTVAGVREAFRDHRFAVVILDNRPPGWEMPGLRQHYREERRIPADMQPRLYTGAKVVPHSVWVPRRAGATK